MSQSHILEKNQAMEEYVKLLRKLVYWPLKYTGFCRFDIVNNQIVQLTRSTVIYNVVLLIVANFSVVFLLYSSIYLGNYLKIPDGLCIFHFALFANIILLNITFRDRNSGKELIDKCIEIDTYLNVKDTTFMRKVVVRFFTFQNGVVTMTNILGGIYLYRVYKVSWAIHVVGSLYFFWLFFAYDDYFFALTLISLNSMRIRYLNGALMKIGNMKEYYLPNQSIFYWFFWNKKFNRLVKFHKRAGIEEFNKAFRMCFEMQTILERFYNFPVLCVVWTIFMGTFVAVQTFIMRVKNTTTMDTEQTYIIVGWAILSWGFVILLTTVTDMFGQQIEQTKLICSYIQLKNNQPPNVYKLTKSILRTIQTRNVVPYILGMFYLDSGFVFSLAASTLVYITMQLQLAFPRISLSIVKFNESNV